MPRFGIRIEGRGYLRQFERHWIVFQRSVIVPVGFFTTRWAVADDAAAAANIVVMRLQREAMEGETGLIGDDPLRPLQSWMTESWEEAMPRNSLVPDGAGFTFYTLDSD